MPIRLWSTVVSQLEKRPRETTAAAGSGEGATSTATGSPGETFDVGEQGVQLAVAPALADRGHLVAAVLEQGRECVSLLEDRVAAEVGAVATLRFEPVAGRADPVESHLAEV